MGGVVELIHPARFLFNAGSTPKAWNKKMLNDEHFKILHYEAHSAKIFPNTDIKGGLAISYRDGRKNFGAMETFTPYNQLNCIFRKVHNSEFFRSFESIVVTRTIYRLTDKVHKDYPEAIKQLSKGHAYDMSTNIFERLPQIFFEEKPDNRDYVRFLGREKNKRVYKYVLRSYINRVGILDKYKVLIPKGNGSGKFGEIISIPVLADPGTGSTETFLSIGVFETKDEALNVLSYIKTKFCRALLGVLKITQDITPAVWRFVPLQDFTTASDIDWTKPIPEIDRQLYAKYGLDENEISFIEKNVKEMK